MDKFKNGQRIIIGNENHPLYTKIGRVIAVIRNQNPELDCKKAIVVILDKLAAGQRQYVDRTKHIKLSIEDVELA